MNVSRSSANIYPAQYIKVINFHIEPRPFVVKQPVKLQNFMVEKNHKFNYWLHKIVFDADNIMNNIYELSLFLYRFTLKWFELRTDFYKIGLVVRRLRVDERSLFSSPHRFSDESDLWQIFYILIKYRLTDFFSVIKQFWCLPLIRYTYTDKRQYIFTSRITWYLYGFNPKLLRKS